MAMTRLLRRPGIATRSWDRSGIDVCREAPRLAIQTHPDLLPCRSNAMRPLTRRAVTPLICGVSLITALGWGIATTFAQTAPGPQAPQVSGASQAAQAAPPANYQRLIGQVRQHRAEGLTAPDGWLSLVALQRLLPGETTVGSAAGNTLVLEHAPAHMLTLQTTGEGAHGAVWLLAADKAVTVDGAPAKAGARMVAEGPEASQLRAGPLLATLIERGDRMYLRVKDAGAPTRTHFHGLRWYPVAPRFFITARWAPAGASHTLTVPNVLGQIQQEPSPGAAQFTIDGKQVSLEPIVEGKDTLFFIFRDTTSRTATYGAGRFLYTDLPSNGLNQPGTLVLDFNQAQNPPCAYTAYATCPLPPIGNRLPVAIPAGEKRYHD